MLVEAWLYCAVQALAVVILEREAKHAPKNGADWITWSISGLERIKVQPKSTIRIGRLPEFVLDLQFRLTTVAVCFFCSPQEAKLAPMGRLSSHIDEAYPVTTRIFVREASASDMMLAGSLVSELPTVDNRTRGARVYFLICPTGVKADAKKTMMERLTADISDVCSGSDDIFIIHLEDERPSVMLNGHLQSENPKFRQTTPG